MAGVGFLSRYGLVSEALGGVGALALAIGAATGPSRSGIYANGAGLVGIVAGGTEVARFQAGGASFLAVSDIDVGTPTSGGASARFYGAAGAVYPGAGSIAIGTDINGAFPTIHGVVPGGGQSGYLIVDNDHWALNWNSTDIATGQVLVYANRVEFGTQATFVNILATTAASSTTTGALRVGGGVGIVGALFVGGIITQSAALRIDTTGAATYVRIGRSITNGLGSNQVTIGNALNNNTADSTVIGANSSNTSGTRSVVIGATLASSAGDSVIIGHTGTVAAAYGIAIGAGITVASTAAQGVAIGRDTQTISTNSVAIGFSSRALTSGSSNSVCIGSNARSSALESICIGRNTTISAAGSQAIAIGKDVSVTAADAIAIGDGASVTHTGAIAIGTGAVSVAGSCVIGSTGSPLDIVVASGRARARNLLSNAQASGTAAAIAGDVRLCQTDTGPVTITLPTPTANTSIAVKKVTNDINTVTITPSSGTIDGAGSLVLSGFNDGVILMASGVNWFILASTP